MKPLPKNIKNIHMIAICGMGMGSLAGLFKQAGYQVTGSDHNVYPPMSNQLDRLGISYQIGFSPDNIPDDVDLVIIGNAVSKDNAEVLEVSRRELPFISMPEAVHEFFLQQKTSLVVAGTHGKTTTSSLLAYLLYSLDRDPSFLIGGVLNNFSEAYHLGKGNEMVIEGDEYDTAYFDKGPKFLHFAPKALILTSIEFDHADIYEDLSSIRKSFQKVLRLVPGTGTVAACIDFPEVKDLISSLSCPVTTYSTKGPAHFEARHIVVKAETTEFDFYIDGQYQDTWQSPLLGEYNVANLLGVLIILNYLQVPLKGLKRPLMEFQGVKRRQEVRGIVKDRIIIEDFAHHPTAVQETLQALKARYPDYRLWAIFEPRSQTSRRNIFQDRFTEALGFADYVLMAPPYQGEKIPEAERLNPEAICQKLNQRQTMATSHDNVASIVKQVLEESQPHDVIVIMSNGGFEGIYEKILEGLKKISK